jgi:hypothetical protein
VLLGGGGGRREQGVGHINKAKTKKQVGRYVNWKVSKEEHDVLFIPIN